VLSRFRSLMTGYLFEYASAAKNPARVSRLPLHLLVRFSISKQLFAPSKTMADSPTDIDVVFRLQAPERREGTLLLGGPFAIPHGIFVEPRPGLQRPAAGPLTGKQKQTWLN